MGLPPTSPRLKFVHTHPGSSAAPRRPPRHPPSPSTRSRSLELLDQDEKKSVLPIPEPEPLPRPRSRSLDGLLDEDGIGTEIKTEETSMQSENNAYVEKSESPLNDKTMNEEIGEGSVSGSGSQPLRHEANNSETNSNPMPVPRAKGKVPAGIERRMESAAKIVLQEDTRISSSSEETSDKEEIRPVRPPKPNRVISLDGQLSSSEKPETKEMRKSSEDVHLCDNNLELITERLTTGDDKSTLLKAKSCGAGLDSDGSVSSNEYKPSVKGQGSLLSLPTGAEPKRKKNFMDKCVNKVRSFIRK